MKLIEQYQHRDKDNEKNGKGRFILSKTNANQKNPSKHALLKNIDNKNEAH